FGVRVGARGVPGSADVTDERGGVATTDAPVEREAPTRAGRRAHRAKAAHETWGRLVAQALVLALVVAGTTAFAALHKTVTLDVDGSVTSVPAFGRTVVDVLAANGVTVGEGDLVAPGLTSLVADGSEIVVRHGRE